MSSYVTIGDAADVTDYGVTAHGGIQRSSTPLMTSAVSAVSAGVVTTGSASEINTTQPSISTVFVSSVDADEIYTPAAFQVDDTSIDGLHSGMARSNNTWSGSLQRTSDLLGTGIDMPGVNPSGVSRVDVEGPGNPVSTVNVTDDRPVRTIPVIEVDMSHAQPPWVAVEWLEPQTQHATLGEYVPVAVQMADRTGNISLPEPAAASIPFNPEGIIESASRRNAKTQISSTTIGSTQIRNHKSDSVKRKPKGSRTKLKAATVGDFVEKKHSSRNMSTQTLTDQGTQTMSVPVMNQKSAVSKTSSSSSGDSISSCSTSSGSCSSSSESDKQYEKKESKDAKRMAVSQTALSSVNDLEIPPNPVQKEAVGTTKTGTPMRNDTTTPKKLAQEDIQPKRTESFKVVPAVLKPRSELRKQIEPDGIVTDSEPEEQQDSSSDSESTGASSDDDPPPVPPKQMDVEPRRLSQLDEVKNPQVQLTEIKEAIPVKPLTPLHHRPQLLGLFSIQTYESHPNTKTKPTGLCIAPNGNYVIIDYLDKTVKIFNTMGQLKVEFGQGILKKPWSASLLSNGNIAVSDPGDRSIKVFTPLGKFIKKFEASNLVEPYGIAKSSNGDVLITDKGGANGIYVFNQDGFLKGLLSNANSDPFGEWAQYLVVDRNDNIIISDIVAHKVKIFSSRAELKSEHGGLGTGTAQLHCPQGVCIDDHGHILIADTMNSRVKMLTPTGEFVRDLVTQEHGLEKPQAIAIDNKGNLCVTQDSGEVKIFKYVN